MKLSVLIPSSDQVIKLENLVKQLTKKTVKGIDEIIVAIKEGQTLPLNTKIVAGGKNRAVDYNAAAKIATGGVLVLMHQNTIKIPDDLFMQIRKAFDDKKVVGGGVNIAFDYKHPLLSAVAYLSNYYRMRYRQIIYADQTPFVKREVFERLNGFKQMQIFEDTDFSKRLREQGKLVFLEGPVVTSAHRFVKTGVVMHTLRNQLLKLGYETGISPQTLKHFYEYRITK